MEDVRKLNKEQLLELKTNIDARLRHMEQEEKKQIKKQIKEQLKNKTILSDLDDEDSIFCVNFSGSKIYNAEYVKIYFSQRMDDYTKVTTQHDSLSMGCSASIRSELMEGHYFLLVFSSCMYFFTLKSETWKEDIKKALDFHIKIKKENTNKNIKELKDNLKNFMSAENNKIIKDKSSI